MAKQYLKNPIFILFFLGIFVSSCNAQVTSNSTEIATIPLKSGPKITGTPPSLNPDHNPYNDTLLVSQYIRCIFQDSKGNYWFGPAGQSVVRYDGETLHYFSKDEFFQGNKHVKNNFGNSVHAIAEDFEGNIWFGTEHGIVKYDPRHSDAHEKSFRSYTQVNGLSSTKVGRKGILVDKSGNIWVGTQGGVFRYIPSEDKPGGQCFSQFTLIPTINVKDIMEDNAGNIWFASQEKGVFQYDPSRSGGQGKFVHNLSQKEGLSDNYAGGIAQDKSGNFWFTMKDGICRYDGNTFTDFTTLDGLGGSEVWGLFIEKSGIIWITARGSTTRFDPSIPRSDPKAFKVFRPEDGLNCCVQSMYQDRLGNMWWGTGQGLYRFDGNSFYQIKQDGPW